MDRILIRDLVISCIIGIREKERTHRQNVTINLVLEMDLCPAGASDRIEDTLDYAKLKDQIAAYAEQSRCFLIERLAADIADRCLADDRVQAVTVTVDKPGALTKARSVAVQIHRTRTAGTGASRPGDAEKRIGMV